MGDNSVQGKAGRGEKRKGGRVESTPKPLKLSRLERQALSRIGRRGGQAKVTKGFGSLTPEERKANARRAAAARWGKKAKK